MPIAVLDIDFERVRQEFASTFKVALPAMIQNQEIFDFAFIDGWHTFDHALVDFFYVNRLLNVQGIVVFDDVNYPQLRKLIRYISNYQNHFTSYPYIAEFSFIHSV